MLSIYYHQSLSVSRGSDVPGMKGPLDQTKVVLRHLPPSITKEMLIGQIDSVFAGRYNGVSFCSGKSSQKQPIYSRAYINFNRPEDVIDFAEFFNGHVFVNEKGTQYRTIVEYAPSQRVPKQRSRKDGREGSIEKDPEYMAFLEFLAKPVENLPSAEVQLERREAERSGAAKDALIVTPLMDFIRKKRASKGVSRRSSSNRKLSRRAGKFGDGSPMSSKRSSEKRRVSTTMYVLRDSSRNSSSKDRSGHAVVSKQDEQHQSDKSTSLSASRVELRDENENSGGSAIADSGKNKIILLKGKERDNSNVSASRSQMKNVGGSPIVRQNHRRDGSERMIRSILINKDSRQGQSFIQAESQTQASHPEKEERPPWPQNPQAASKYANGVQEERAAGNELPSFGSSEKQERRTRNKDRPDRGVWAPLCRSDGSHASDKSFSTRSPIDSTEGNVEVRILGNRRGSHSYLDNGFHKPVSRREHPQGGGKDFDGSLVGSERKPSKRGGGASGYGSHEKQVWVQKTSSGT